MAIERMRQGGTFKAVITKKPSGRGDAFPDMFDIGPHYVEVVVSLYIVLSEVCRLQG